MDKTYNDLMDIVNRTKKFDTQKTPRSKPRPTPVVEEEDFGAPVEYDVVEEKPKRKTKSSSSLFADSSAISSMLEKSSKKKSTSTAKKTTTAKKKTTKKVEEPKPETDNDTKSEEIKIEKVEKKTEKPKQKPQTTSSVIDKNDPKNAQLYEALKDTLFSGGTDISEYMKEDEDLTSTQESLKDIRAKREAQKINAEITKEQQEYEQLFTGSLGSFYSEEESTEDQTEDQTSQVNVAEKNAKLASDLDAIKANLQNKKNNPASANSTMSVEREKRANDTTFELETGNKDLDRKIAEYYKRKQEKIDKYNAEEDYNYDTPAEDDSNEPVDYDAIFNGSMTTRNELFGITPEESEEVTATAETLESSAETETEEQSSESDIPVSTEETIEDTSKEITNEISENNSDMEEQSNEIVDSEQPAESSETKEETTEQSDKEENSTEDSDDKDNHIKSLLSDLLYSKKEFAEEIKEKAEKEQSENTEQTDDSTPNEEVEQQAEESTSRGDDYASVWGADSFEQDEAKEENSTQSDSEENSADADEKQEEVVGDNFVMTDAEPEPQEIVEYADRSVVTVEEESEENMQDSTETETDETSIQSQDETEEVEKTPEIEKPEPIAQVEDDEDGDFVFRKTTTTDSKENQQEDTEVSTETEDSIEEIEEEKTEDLSKINSDTQEEVEQPTSDTNDDIYNLSNSSDINDYILSSNAGIEDNNNSIPEELLRSNTEDIESSSTIETEEKSESEAEDVADETISTIDNVENDDDILIESTHARDNIIDSQAEALVDKIIEDIESKEESSEESQEQVENKTTQPFDNSIFTLENYVEPTEEESISEKTEENTDQSSVEEDPKVVSAEQSEVQAEEIEDSQVEENSEKLAETVETTSQEQTEEIEQQLEETIDVVEPIEEQQTEVVSDQNEVVEENSDENQSKEDEVASETTNDSAYDNHFESVVANERIYQQTNSNASQPQSKSLVDDDDNTLVMSTLPENKYDLFGNEIHDEEETEDSQPEEVEEKDDTISRDEFYNEMARLQENLINELKGNKVETESKDFFANVDKDDDEELVEKVANKIIEVLEDQGVEETEEPEEELTPELEPTPEPEIEEVEEEKPITSVNPELEVGAKAEPVDPEKFDEYNLLNKDIALNDEDLEYQEKSEEEKPKQSDSYFYLSPEDNEKKAVNDEYMTIYDDHATQSKEVGDINIFKNIGNAIPSSEIVKEKTTETPETNDNEIETIYTLMGIEKRTMAKEKNNIKVLYVASECQPFVASGGLADVAGSLPRAIAEQGDIDIRVIMPLYGTIKADYRDKFEYLGNFTVHLSWRQEYCGLFRYFKDGVTYYFIDNERYFKRDKLYGYYDDGERFAYFSKAIVEALPHLNFFPDIIHCNDWQSALVSTYIKTGNWSDFRYYKIRHIYTIHNVEYQGVYGMENLKDLFGIDPRFRNDVDYNGDINLTKAAIQYCDKFTTVSDSYCDNLKQPYCSRGLHHIIIRNEYKLSGIINGIDYDFYNPATDTHIFKNYDVGCIEEKVLNKKLWQDEIGLPVDGDTPMIALVSRLVGHKGLDLFTKIVHNTLQQDIQLVVVGTGDQKYVDFFKQLESKYPTKVRVFVDTYSNEIARKAYAASDIFVMPSKIEPCGLSQMISSRYGSVPIVREVGGLKDSIKDFGCEGGGNGYTFTNYNPNDLQYQLDRAIKDYSNKSEWKEKMKICMTQDFTWKKPAMKYTKLYESLCDK